LSSDELQKNKENGKEAQKKEEKKALIPPYFAKAKLSVVPLIIA
jgi:hypothetical protein